MTGTPETLTPQKLADIFGFDVTLLPDITGHHKNVEELKAKVREFRRVIRDAWRKLAFEDHPDKGGDGKRVAAASPVYKWIMTNIKESNIRLMKPRPQPATFVRFYTSSSGWSDSSTTNSTTTGGSYQTWTWRK